ncbi:MAG: acyl carrier protein [Sulfuricurvum sp.]|jgi:acyl carrier protein
MREKIVNIILEALKDLSDELQNSTLAEPTLHTRLYGGSGMLDSLALVSLIADVEERVSLEFGKDILLADERAMSAQTSPFRSVETLSSYIEELLR